MFMDLFNELVRIVVENWEAFVALAGVAAFIPAFISLLKKFGIVGEDEANTYSGMIQAILFLIFVGLRVFIPNFDLEVADAVLNQIAGVIVFILSFLSQFGISKLTYEKVFKGRLGVFGFYHS